MNHMKHLNYKNWNIFWTTKTAISYGSTYYINLFNPSNLPMCHVLGFTNEATEA